MTLRARHIGIFAIFLAGDVFVTAGSAAQPAAPTAPYTMKCFLDRDLVVNEDLAAKPTFKDGQWQARTWSPDHERSGLELVIQQGANATCVVKQNVK
jgi:hypothetical protein